METPTVLLLALLMQNVPLVTRDRIIRYIAAEHPDYLDVIVCRGSPGL